MGLRDPNPPAASPASSSLAITPVPAADATAKQPPRGLSLDALLTPADPAAINPPTRTPTLPDTDLPATGNSKAASSLNILRTQDGKDIAPVRTRREALDLLSHMSAPRVAVWFRGRTQAIVLPRDTASAQIQTAQEDQLILQPLVGTTPNQWLPAVEQTTAALRLAHWLGDVHQPATVPTNSAAKEQAARAERENLHRSIYQMLLGDTPSVPATNPAPKAH